MHLLPLYCTAILLCTSLAANAQWQGHVHAGSEYNYRGLSFTEDSITASALLEYQWEQGVYAGIWIGHVDLPDTPLGSEELDYLLGYSYRLNSMLAIDTTLIHYSYPNADLQGDYDWNEWQLALHIDQQWTLRLAVNNNWLARDKSSRMLELSWRQVLIHPVTYDLTVGYNDVDNVIGAGYRYQELGVNYTWRPLELRLALTGADSRAAAVFGANNTENRWAFSITWVF